MIDGIMKSLKEIEKKYKEDRDICSIECELRKIVEEHKDVYGCGDLFIFVGEEWIDEGLYEAGITLFKITDELCIYINNNVCLYLRLAEYYIELGEKEKGEEYLILLCTKGPDNYEESIEINELTPIWNKYRHLVAGKVPKSISVNLAKQPLSEDECTMKLSEILKLKGDELLEALYEHSRELSGAGEHLELLNEYMTVVFVINEFCEEVNSGGISHYLYYYGNHYYKLLEAVEKVGATQVLEILQSVMNKFPGKMKKQLSLNKMQDIIDKLEDKGVDFEDEDEKYYTYGEKELIGKVIIYAEKML